MFDKYKKYQFLFEELVSRDFKKKYKGTILGMAWSILYPILNLLVLSLVFTKIFGRTTPHYTIYLFCGTLIMSFFRESTKNGMSALVSNRGIITKINVPKYLFLFSKNVSSMINFGLTLIIFFIFCIFDHIEFHWNFFALIYPIVCLCIFNIGVGLILSALYVFFKDISYLYDIFLTLLNYLSAVFYRIDIYSYRVQRMFLCNPIYCFIHYFRCVVINGNLPSLQFHLLILFYALLAFFIGYKIYHRYNRDFIYYM